jgi:hypothetical protein
MEENSITDNNINLQLIYPVTCVCNLKLQEKVLICDVSDSLEVIKIHLRGLTSQQMFFYTNWSKIKPWTK